MSEQEKSLQSVRERMDRVLDEYDEGSFIEVTGKVGGDTCTYRVYEDGSVTER